MYVHTHTKHWSAGHANSSDLEGLEAEISKWRYPMESWEQSWAVMMDELLSSSS